MQMHCTVVMFFRALSFDERLQDSEEYKQRNVKKQVQIGCCEE